MKNKVNLIISMRQFLPNQKNKNGYIESGPDDSYVLLYWGIVVIDGITLVTIGSAAGSILPPFIFRPSK